MEESFATIARGDRATLTSCRSAPNDRAMNRSTFALAVGLCWLASLGRSHADSLATLLQAIAETERLATPLRAEGTLDSDGLEGRKQDRVVIVERAGADPTAPRQVYVELFGAKLRVLALGPAALYVANDGKAGGAKSDQPLARTTFTTEDWLPFSRERCAAMRIADLSAEQFTLVCEPRKPPSQYSLMVYKFDREKRAMRQALLYKDTMTNLVKMLRHDEFVLVAGQWRPQRIVLQDFKLRTKDELSLDWKPATPVPATLFDAKTFATAALPQAAASQKP
jgi:hypothetical protein